MASVTSLPELITGVALLRMTILIKIEMWKIDGQSLKY